MGIAFDGPNKRINLTLGTTTVGVRELVSRWADWVVLSDNAKYLQAFDQVGGNDIDVASGTRIPIYAYLMNGWRLKPQEANHTLVVNDGILLVQGGGDPFVSTAGNFVVRINYQQPVQAITVSTGGGSGGLSPDQSAQLTRIEQLLRNKRVTNPATGKQTIFADDSSTVLLEGNLFEDAAGTQAYRGQGAERSERLT